MVLKGAEDKIREDWSPLFKLPIGGKAIWNILGKGLGHNFLEGLVTLKDFLKRTVSHYFPGGLI